jgi:hypothetical protein
MAGGGGAMMAGGGGDPKSAFLEGWYPYPNECFNEHVLKGTQNRRSQRGRRGGGGALFAIRNTPACANQRGEVQTPSRVARRRRSNRGYILFTAWRRVFNQRFTWSASGHFGHLFTPPCSRFDSACAAFVQAIFTCIFVRARTKPIFPSGRSRSGTLAAHRCRCTPVLQLEE